MSNTERIQANNAELREVIEMAENLPDAGGVADPVIEPLEITENGTYTAPDGVNGYSPVAVNVPIPDGYIQPSGTLEVAENGLHDVTEYASVNVNVSDSGGGDSEIVDAILDGTITELASDVTSLSDYALASRKKLTSISLPNVKTIGQYAFSGSGYTYGYVNVSLPSLVSAGDYAFYSADFREITLPKLLVVSSFMFNSSSIIRKVDLGSATQIKGASFIGCTNIKTLIIRTNTVCSLAYATVFNSSAILGGTGYIYVPSALVDSYKSATNWSTYANQVRAIEDYPEITGG